MDENREDRPLSSEELLRRAREGLGDSDAAQGTPADFAIESYPPPATQPPVADLPPAATEPSSFSNFEEPTPQPAVDSAFEPRAEPSSWAPPPVDNDSDMWNPPASADPARPRRSGGGAGRIWILLAILAVVGVGVFSLFNTSKTVNEIAVGDCMDVPDEDVFSTIDTIDCTEPHDLEVFALVDLSEYSFDFSSIASYPGDDEVYTAAFDACWIEFETYVGVPYEDSVIYMDAFTPTLEGWDEQGDRIVNCVLYQVNAAGTDLLPSTRSLRNANR